MVLKAAFIVPHGALILDATSSHQDGRYELHQAMRRVAEDIAKINPDVILITSPHGISLSEDFGIYHNIAAHGTAEWEGEYLEYQVDIEINLEFSQELYSHLKKNSCQVSKITAFSQGVSIPLRWGESVPLWFLKDLKTIKYCIISQPQKRFEPSSEFLDEVTLLGNIMKNFISSHQKNIVVIISADLAHTHLEEGPYGYYPLAENTDQLYEYWMYSIGILPPPLELKNQVKEALCCGNIGFYLLHGLLFDSNLINNMIIRATPTYYGMMVASFLPK